MAREVIIHQSIGDRLLNGMIGEEAAREEQKKYTGTIRQRDGDAYVVNFPNGDRRFENLAEMLAWAHANTGLIYEDPKIEQNKVFQGRTIDEIMQQKRQQAQAAGK